MASQRVPRSEKILFVISIKMFSERFPDPEISFIYEIEIGELREHYGSCKIIICDIEICDLKEKSET